MTSRCSAGRPRAWRRARMRAADRGGVLLGVLVLATVGALVTVPLTATLVAVREHGAVTAERARRTEALHSAGRLALSDPRYVFSRCAAADEGDPADLGTYVAPEGGRDAVVVETTCTERAVVTADDPGHVVVALTGVGATLPAGVADVPANRVVVFDEDHDPDSGVSPEEFWLLVPVTGAPAPDAIWLPPLPLRPAAAPAPVVEASGCTVWSPGGYPAVDDDGDGVVDPILLEGEHYFASGVYHLERPLAIARGARVVVGAGATAGCATDAVVRARLGGAAVRGLGATLVLGGAGSVVLEPGAGEGAVSFVVERRVTPAGDPNTHLDGIAVMTVNGMPGPDAVILPGLLAVPESQLVVLPPGSEPTSYVADGGYAPVDGRPPCDEDPATGWCTGPLTAAPALLDLSAVGAAAVHVAFDGALIAPQSRITLGAPDPGGSLGVTVRGALVAASVDIGGVASAALPPGVSFTVDPGGGRVLQRVLRLQSIVLGDGPNITSTIDVVVNQTAMHAVTAWRID